MGVGVGLLVTLQMIPLGKDDAAIAVDKGGEITGRSLVEQPQIASRRVKAPKSADRRRFFVFVQLWRKPGCAIAGAVGGKDNAPIGAIDGADVVIILRLVGDFG